MDRNPRPAPSSQFSLSILGVLILRRATFGSMTRGGVTSCVLGFLFGGLGVGLLLLDLVLAPRPAQRRAAAQHAASRTDAPSEEAGDSNFPFFQLLIVIAAREDRVPAIVGAQEKAPGEIKASARAGVGRLVGRDRAAARSWRADSMSTKPVPSVRNGERRHSGNRTCCRPSSAFQPFEALPRNCDSVSSTFMLSVSE